MQMDLLRSSLKSLCLLLLFACEQKPSPYELVLPPHFPAELNIVERNPLTEEGVLLGKKLFFDPILSGDGSRSCASCHFPSLAFADGKVVPNPGIDYPQRNSMPLFNLAWYPSFFLDGGVKNLESLSFAPLSHAGEMNTDLKAMVARLQADENYPLLFHKVFSTDSIYSALVSRAIAQYLRSLISANAKWDSVQLNLTELSENELLGEQLFTQYCAACHQSPLFTDFNYHRVKPDTLWTDEREFGLLQGRFRITRDSTDLGKFRTPSLRNIAYTAPYLHDGSAADLAHLFEIHQLGGKPMTFSDEEKQHLTAFLMTLSDVRFIQEAKNDSLIASQ